MGLLNWFKPHRRYGIENPVVPITSSTLLMERGQGPHGLPGPIPPTMALMSSTVWSCCRVRAETMASLPLNLYRTTADGGRERATDHPLWSIVHDQPNGIMNSFSWRQRMIYSQLLYGNSVDFIQRNGAGVVMELRPLDPTKVAIGVMNGQKQFGYMGRFYPASDIFHVMDLSRDGVSGESTLGYARVSIGLDLSLARFGAKFFETGTSGQFYISVPGDLDDAQRKRWRETWHENYAGVGNAWKPPLLTNGAELKDLAVMNDDAQFLGSREFSVAEIARWFRVPGHKVGDTSKSSYASMEQQNIEFVTDTIRPDAVRIEQELNAKLLLPSEQGQYYFEFDLNGLLRGDQKTRYDAYAVGRQWGWLSADDVRVLENLNKLPDGQGGTYMVPLNMASAKAMLAVPVAPAGATPEPAPQLSQDLDLEDEADGSRAAGAAVDAATITLADAMGRMHQKEANAVRRAAKSKPGAFAETVEEFYANHQRTLADAMTPSFQALAAGLVGAVHKRATSPGQQFTLTLAAANSGSFAQGVARDACERAKTELVEGGPDAADAVLTAMAGRVRTLAADQAKAFAATLRS